MDVANNSIDDKEPEREVILSVQDLTVGFGSKIVLDKLNLDIDPKSHPAWTGIQRVMDTGGQVAKFNKKFAGLGMRKK